jgi:MFS superfamily sulfate permease-like transporter|tara:strand:- start:1472 stop:1834 length:363 start_codon:yes stop_codon:yes gene_type:complete
MASYIWRFVEFDENGEGIKKGWIPKPKGRSAKSASVHMDLDSFVSPIDGTVISSRPLLEEHNRRHGVTNDLDSLREKTANEMARARNISPYGTKKQRIEAIRDSIERVSSSGYRREQNYE